MKTKRLPTAPVEVDIKCPHCGLKIGHTYTDNTYSPVYTQCKFCQSLIVWKKTSTVVIAPAHQIKYIKWIE
jgi:DNA-directed RNA polymerase subunit RPC12/RpoP